MNISNCQHQEVQGRNCRECGVYVLRYTNTVGLKSALFEQFGRDHRSLKNIRKAALGFCKANPSYSLKPEAKDVFNLLASRLMVSRETYALALYLLETQSASLLSSQYIHNQDRLRLIAIACFLHAIKTLEIKYKAPRISDIKRILRIQIDKKEMLKIEAKLLESNTQLATFLDFLNVYLVNGGVFSFENIRDPQKFELKANEICWEYLRNGAFLNLDQQELASYILYRARKQFQLPQIWNLHIQYYTQIPQQRILKIVEEVGNRGSQTSIMQVNNNSLNTMSNTRNNLFCENKRNTISDIEESLQKIRKSYNKLRKQTLSPAPKLHAVKSGSSINKHCFRVQ